MPIFKTEPQDWLKRNIMPGKRIKLFYNPNNINNVTYHIRALVDDEYVVVRWWNASERKWAYGVKNMSMFELWYISNLVSVV